MQPFNRFPSHRVTVAGLVLEIHPTFQHNLIVMTRQGRLQESKVYIGDCVSTIGGQSVIFALNLAAVFPDLVVTLYEETHF